MKEQQLLSTIMASREAYDKLYEHIKGFQFTEYGRIFFDTIKEFYEKDPKAIKADKELVLDRTIQLLPKREMLLKEVLERLPEPVSVPNLLALYEGFKKEKIGLEIIQALTSGMEKRAEALMEQYVDTSIDIEEEGDMYNATPATELEKHFTGSNLIKLRPTILNDLLGGGVPRQAQVCVFARPDVGKSTVSINIACGAAEDGHKVLYIGNEDPAAKMMYRILSRFSRAPEHEIRKAPDKYYELALENGYSNLYFIPMHPGTISELRKWIEKLLPDLVVIDQIRNMHIKPESMTINLEQGVIATRNLAKEFNFVTLVVTQAGASANSKMYLHMDDVEWSNCLAKGSSILMYDGSVRPVESLAVGDRVMGMDSTPRLVRATGKGRQTMYRIAHKNGDEYTVNASHILTLKNVDKRVRYGVAPGELVDIPLKKILENRNQLQYLKGVHVGIEYNTRQKLPIHPYLFGLWLADGFNHTFSISSSDVEMIDTTAKYCEDTQHIRKVNGNNYIIGFGQQPNEYKNKWNTCLRKLSVWKNKHIPHIYRVGKMEERLHLLAGIIDGAGTMRGGGNHAHTFTVYSKTEKFAKEVKQLAQSAGFYAAWHKVSETEFTVNISGDVTRIPTNLARKKASNNSQIEWQCSSITVEELGEAEYYGISVDGDNRFILGDSYIVTHNTGVAGQMDLMIGVGQTQEMKEQRRVMLAFPKNKLSAPISPFSCEIDYETQRLFS